MSVKKLLIKAYEKTISAGMVADWYAPVLKAEIVFIKSLSPASFRKLLAVDDAEDAVYLQSPEKNGVHVAATTRRAFRRAMTQISIAVHGYMPELHDEFAPCLNHAHDKAVLSVLSPKVASLKHPANFSLFQARGQKPRSRISRRRNSLRGRTMKYPAAPPVNPANPQS
jgi:hypothetical protein